MNKEVEQKIAMYKALRSVKEKMDKGLLLILGKNGTPDFKESLFLINRVINAIILAGDDPDLQKTKNGLDAQISPKLRGGSDNEND
jgi:hypothetical protein